MLNYDDQQLDTVVAALKALAHPTRLRIFDLLMAGVHCSCEISEQLGLAPNLVSYHIKALVDVGLVVSERDTDDARWIYYSIRRERLDGLHASLAYLTDTARIQPRVPQCGPSCSKGCSGR